MAMRQAPIVLVHGAWQTAATWDLVSPHFQKSGRRVFNALLTGLEADADALTEAVNLETHTRDVEALLETENLNDVVLVGHSYAGMIITGVAERARRRIAHLVYIDAFVPDHGQSALQLLPESLRDAFRTQAEADGGWRLRSSDRQLDLWGLENGPARDFVRARLCDFTIRCFEQPLVAPNHAATTLARTYISCVREGYPAKIVFDQFARRARREAWTYHELPTGHDCHVESPEVVSELLLKAAM
jgi:pimeloyl-ACP methyl ester carboxylesterase